MIGGIKADARSLHYGSNNLASREAVQPEFASLRCPRCSGIPA